MKGEGNQIAFEARTYDPRLGVFLSRDPLAQKYAGQSPYAYAANNPIRFIDALGMASDDPPGWWKWARQNMPITHVFEKEYWGYVADDLGRVGKDAGNALAASTLGSLNGFGRSISFGLYSRSTEDLRINDRYSGWFDGGTTVFGAAPNPIALSGGGGSSPSLALAGASTVYKALTQQFRLGTTLFAYSTSGTQEPGDEGVTVNHEGSDVPIYRGGDKFELTPNQIKINPETGFVKPTHGLSLDVIAKNVEKFGGAFQLKFLPEELKIIQRGQRPTHYEVVPSQEMPVNKFQDLLNQIKVKLAE